MTRRRELARRLAALADIAGIMTAMKSLAVMEMRLLLDFLPAQTRMVASIEAAAADFLAWHPDLAGDPPSAGTELCILVGSEQGFCGDFNETIAARARASPSRSAPAQRWAVIGQRLAAKLGDDTRTAFCLPGASLADEIPAVLLRLSDEVRRWLGHAAADGGLTLLYHSDTLGDLRARRVLPLPASPAAAVTALAFPPDLTLAPTDFLDGLTRHYLYAVLNEVLHSSLLAENRQRQAHMERALQRLDDDRARLRLAHNAQRQEEITEEIEIILLSAEMTEPAERPRPASGA